MRGRRSFGLIPAFVLLAAVVAGCFTTHDILVGPTWSLVQINGLPAVDGATVTFTADTFEGDTGCNRFSGTFHLDGNRILLDSEQVTEAPCPSEDATAQEQAFLAALEGLPTYAIDTGTGHLRLTTDRGNILVFEAR